MTIEARKQAEKSGRYSCLTIKVTEYAQRHLELSLRDESHHSSQTSTDGSTIT